MKNIIILFVFLTCLFAKGQAEDNFTWATEAYNEGEFKKAIELYETILEDGQHSAALYYNLGNSYYKLNEIASSIYYYEKALLLSPNDPEILNNLGYAQNMTLDAIDTMPETGLSRIYKMATNRLSFDQWAYVGVFFMFLFVILYILFYYSQYSSRKRWAFIGSFIALFIAIVAVVFAYIQYDDFNKNQPAIVFADEVGINAEPNNKSDEVFVLHAGTKVNVLDELNDWKKIRIADGKTGWITSENIRLLKDF
ncbi:tetratricopeptide repeat protein [Maribacter aestuarii]|uniref:tetratricopeptide repeat protein n=1 Tax=Maribacter aestuarii TaxID=1130723 RepID=UPI00248BB378|nr:tetratricopeptide repeat protein [Maribacter aestuarii]